MRAGRAGRIGVAVGALATADELIGGAGADQFVGTSGDDTMRADDDEADTSISGGPGIDTAYYDAGLDPTAIATETKIAA